MFLASTALTQKINWWAVIVRDREKALMAGSG